MLRHCRLGDRRLSIRRPEHYVMTAMVYGANAAHARHLVIQLRRLAHRRVMMIFLFCTTLYLPRETVARVLIGTCLVHHVRFWVLQQQLRKRSNWLILMIIVSLILGHARGMRQIERIHGSVQIGTLVIIIFTRHRL